MIGLSAILPAIANASGVTLADLLLPLRTEFWNERGYPRDFRTGGQPPSQAGGMKPDGRLVAFPAGLPYVAGTTYGDDVVVTGVELAPGVLWYGDHHHAKLVVKTVTLPLAMVPGLAGRRVADVVDHPVLRLLDDEIVAVHQAQGNAVFTTTIGTLRIDDPLDMPTPRNAFRRAA